MDKYFYILLLISVTRCRGQLSGSGSSCPEETLECIEENEICFRGNSDSVNCYCPYGFKGDNCEEPMTDLIDEKCELPDKPGDLCDRFELTIQCTNNNCQESEICCSTGCGTTCVVNPELKCTTKNDCKPNQGCYKYTEEVNICFCAFGFEGEDCTDHLNSDLRCPFPNDIIDVCENIKKEECLEHEDCPSKHICCVAPDACSTTCLPLGCENAAELKTCTDKNKLCINDDSTDVFSCICPQGYVGTMCEIALLDERCEFPEVAGDTCLEFEYPTTCTKNEDCEGDKYCCSTGCGTQCVDPADSPPRKPLNPLLIALALSNRGRQTPVIPAPYVPYCPPNLCGQLVCPTNVGARCQPIRGRCDIHFYDQYTNHLITQNCPCNRGAQEFSSCFANSCSDIYGRPLVCRGNPNARCRVTRCGFCLAYWIDERTGQRVQCANEY
ncbi:uncharacterized protein LOC120328035 isoform X1 [Styela clava]